MNSLRKEIRFYLSTYYDCASYDDAVNEILSMIEKRIDSIKVDHYPIGDCPECDSIMLKQFMEMLK